MRLLLILHCTSLLKDMPIEYAELFNAKETRTNYLNSKNAEQSVLLGTSLTTELLLQIYEVHTIRHYRTGNEARLKNESHLPVQVNPTVNEITNGLFPIGFAVID